MKKGFAPLVLVIIVLVVATIGAVAYIQLKPKFTSQPAVSQSPQTTAIQPSPISVQTDETANWKIYEDKQNKFSLKYPDYKEVNIFQTDKKNNFPPIPYCTKQSTGISLAVFAIEMYSTETVQKRSAIYEPMPDLYLTIAVFPYSQNMTIEDWYKQNCFDQSGTKTETVINGLKGLKISGGLGAGGANTRIVLLPKYDKIYLISSESTPNLSETILSTFRFD